MVQTFLMLNIYSKPFGMAISFSFYLKKTPVLVISFNTIDTRSYVKWVVKTFQTSSDNSAQFSKLFKFESNFYLYYRVV